MKLRTKFNLIFLAVFGLGLVLAGLTARNQLQADAYSQVTDRAQIMMDTAMAMRQYTTEHIKPVIAAAAPDKGFHSETVPAFAATELFNYLRVKYPDYAYKEAALNPTNPRDRAEEWESDIINQFRNHPEIEGVTNTRATPDGLSIYIARPLRATNSCMECHSTPETAPPAMVKLYGSANGFNWGENEVIAARIVSVPTKVPEAMAAHEFRRLTLSLLAVGLVTLAVLNLVLMLTVTRPVSRLAQQADLISRGQMEINELPVTGRCEISVLAGAFNRMHRSLRTAMKLLDKK